MPGGALTANTQMMRDNGILDRYPEVIDAMGEVVRLGGFGTSVTPVSQFYFQQAFNNVMFGPWEKFAEGYGKMVLGYFGKTPVPPDPEVVRKASEKMGLEPTTDNPLDLDEANPDKGVAPAKARLEQEGLEVTDENIFIAASCGEKGITFLQGNATTGVRKIEPDSHREAADAYTVSVDGESFVVRFDSNGKASVDGRSHDIKVSEGESAGEASSGASGEDLSRLDAPMAGTVYKIVAQPGEQVAEGDTVVILEAMKMEMSVGAPSSGTVHEVIVKPGDQVTAGQLLATLS
jgi:pyruvate carboxylase subunit B